MAPTLNLGILASGVFVASGGPLYAWGDNTQGQVGDGTTTDRSSPLQVGSDSDWSSIAAGGLLEIFPVAGTFGYSLGIKGGKLYAWGWNSNGQLGDGTTTNRTGGPIQIGSDTSWKAVSAGQQHTLAIKTNGTLWAWGNNGSSRLGDGTTTQRTSPTQIGSDTDWAGVSAGQAHSLAIKTNGKIYAWGNNAEGRTGQGTTSGTTTSPTQIGSDTDWAAVASGAFFSTAIKTNGKIYAWGANDSSQIGDGTTTSRTTPVQIGSDTDWTTISAGRTHAHAIKTNGKLYAWGGNESGGTGRGTNSGTTTTPTQVGSDTNWLYITAGDRIGHAIKTTGALWAWGSNFEGVLGDGTTTQRTSPVQIGSATDWKQISSTKSFGAHALGIRT